MGGAMMGGALVAAAGDIANTVQNKRQAKKQRNFNSEEAEKARAWSAEQAGLTRDFNSAEALLGREFNERMSSTAYQRAMTDMKSSGLNPMLAYMQGGSAVPGGAAGSAATPGGSAASHSGSMGTSSIDGSKIVQSAREAAKHKKEMRLLEKVIQKTNAEIDQTSAAYDKTANEAHLLRQAFPAAENEAAIDRSNLGKTTRKINRVTNSALGAVRTVVTGKAMGR